MNVDSALFSDSGLLTKTASSGFFVLVILGVLFCRVGLQGLRSKLCKVVSACDELLV